MYMEAWTEGPRARGWTIEVGMGRRELGSAQGEENGRPKMKREEKGRFGLRWLEKGTSHHQSLASPMISFDSA